MEKLRWIVLMGVVTLFLPVQATQSTQSIGWVGEGARGFVGCFRDTRALPRTLVYPWGGPCTGLDLVAFPDGPSLSDYHLDRSLRYSITPAWGQKAVLPVSEDDDSSLTMDFEESIVWLQFDGGAQENCLALLRFTDIQKVRRIELLAPLEAEQICDPAKIELRLNDSEFVSYALASLRAAGAARDYTGELKWERLDRSHVPAEIVTDLLLKEKEIHAQEVYPFITGRGYGVGTLRGYIAIGETLAHLYSASRQWLLSVPIDPQAGI